MNNTSAQFFLGIVESRNDPLKLGRYQVRIFGVHSESLSDVPTASLPWAIPLTDSAAISGLGGSASFVEGSLVFVFFMDGESKQQPIILGAAHGIPIGKNPFDTKFTGINDNIDTVVEPSKNTNKVTSSIETSNSSTILDSTGVPVTDSSGKSVKTGTVDYRGSLKDALGKRESSNNYNADNQFGYMGKYQMGASMLVDLGYVKKGTKQSKAALADPANWTGKDGITDSTSFKNNHKIQESVMDAELSMNEKRLKKLGVIDESTTEQEKAGFLATSHLLGTGGARDMKKGVIKSDANGVTGNTYYNLGYKAVSGKPTAIAPENTTIDNTARDSSVNSSVGKVEKNTSPQNNIFGFSDPIGRFPRYLKEQDTNRLARNQNISGTIIPHKEESEDKGVPIANSSSTWDQSHTPYNATYPFNQVYESESGHVMEFDDSPNNERIHLYHRTGTFTEIDRNGTEVHKIIGDKYEIWERNGYVHIKGNVNITVEGDANVFVGNNCEFEVGGNFNARVGGDVNWSVGGEWKTKTGGSESHSNSGVHAIDAETIELNSGESTAGSLSSPTTKASGTKTFSTLTLEPRGFIELSEFETDDMTSVEAEVRHIVLSESGLIDVNPIPPKVEKSITAPTNKEKDKVVSCDSFISGAININDYISPNFRLRDLTKGSSIPVKQGGVSDSEIACNLKNLAENVLEKIKMQYPDMIITSALRPMGSNPRSQHPLGMAADLQFTTKKSSDYIDIAKYIAANVSTDQLILEYRSDKRINGVPTTWLHVSFSKSGNRKQVFTMNNDVRISDFGQLKVIS